MSGHGRREEALRADAVAWRNRVVDDAWGEGRETARAHHVSIDLIVWGAVQIEAAIAAGEVEVSRADLAADRSTRQKSRLLRYLEARGHIRRGPGRDLIRPIVRNT
jgi:hypothetical protein